MVRVAARAGATGVSEQRCQQPTCAYPSCRCSVPFTGPENGNAFLSRELDEAGRKAWNSLARYKFVMFAYHAAWWVKINRIAGARRPNPFPDLVKFARARA